MSLQPEDVKKIAHLARLAIDEQDIPAMAKDLSNILNLVEKMNQVDTSQVKPLSHAYDAVQPLREDEVTEINQRDVFLQNAPQTAAGLYIVPKVIETE